MPCSLTEGTQIGDGIEMTEQCQYTDLNELSPFEIVFPWTGSYDSFIKN